MKRNNNIWLNIIVFTFGCLFSYISCQFQFLEIDFKVNVTSSLISICASIIGLYIAITLKKVQTKSSNIHSYLQPKLDIIWKLFLNFSNTLNINDQIELKEVNLNVKEIYLNINPLKKMFESFGLDTKTLSSLEIKIEDVEKILTEDSKIKNNIINYRTQKTELIIKIDECHSLFVENLKLINSIS